MLKCYNILKTRTLNKIAIRCISQNIGEDSDVILYLKYKGKEEGEKKAN